jgi:S-DNA-T family DNA segregation ATPase FtsK/SpoIIIE
MNIEDPTYIFQAFFNYYELKAEYWEAPKFMIFREIKTAKNKDGSSQHQTITIPFFWTTFEEYKVYFWRYILETFERIKIIQERDFIFNIFDMWNWEKEWNKQKAFYLGVQVGQLKSKIAMTQKNKIWSKVQVMWDRDPMKNLKKIDWSNILSEDLNSIENKIKIAFQNFGVLATYESKNEWYSFDQFLFKTARWITMSKVKSHLPEIIQALEVDWIRIEAPVLWTKFIGVEIPRAERKFAKLEKIKKSKKPLIPIWIDINWKEEFIDLSDSGSPHMIVAWKTWSWKSEFLKTAIYSLKDKWDVILFDPKRTWLIKVKKYASEYFTDLEEIDFKLKMYLQEMNIVYSKLEDLECESIYEANENIKGKWKRKFKEVFIIIDEFASLAYAKIERKIINKKWVEEVVMENIWESIIWTVRQLTNLWRAAWIHLIIATQRPDIQVIPWNIKANVSTRICFALASEIDSKVVLDEVWAEKLLSKWDMLFKNEWKMKRLQWFYI